MQEESGLTGEAVIRPVGIYTYCTTDGNGLHIRHVFEVRSTCGQPVTWSHRVMSSGADNDLIFDYFWLPLERADILIGQMGRYRLRLGRSGILNLPFPGAGKAGHPDDGGRLMHS